MFGIPVLRELLDQSFPNRDYNVADFVLRIVYAIPPEKPGLLGLMRYVFWLIGGMVAWGVAQKFLIPQPEPLPTRQQIE